MSGSWLVCFYHRLLNMIMPLWSADLYLWYDVWVQSALVSLLCCLRVEMIPSEVLANFGLRVSEIPAAELGPQLSPSLSGGNPISGVWTWQDSEWRTIPSTECIRSNLQVGEIPSAGWTLAGLWARDNPISRVGPQLPSSGENLSAEWRTLTSECGTITSVEWR